MTRLVSPADLPKDGGRFDLPIALALLAATCQIDGRFLIPYELYGELSLGGELRPARGMLPARSPTRAPLYMRGRLRTVRNIPARASTDATVLLP